MDRANNPSRSRAWLPAIGFLLLAVAWSWPLPLHAASRFAHDPGDPLLNTFLLWWNARVVPLSPAMWNAPFYWPVRDALALTEHEAGIGLLGSPVQWLGGSPLLAYNLILIASAWWAGLAVHALVRRLTANEAAAWCAGVLSMFAPYRASQLAHLQVLVTWWIPLALLALHAYYADGRRRWLLLFGISWLMEALSNGYYMFFVPVLIAGWIAVFTPWRTGWRRALPVLATWAAFSLPLLPVLYKYYTVQHQLNLSRTRTEMQMYGATWTSFLHAGPLLRFWPSLEARSQEDFLFPGVAALAVVLAAAIGRRARGPLARPFLFYGGAALACTWLAVGPSSVQWSLGSLTHAYDWVAWLPGYGGLRVPERFFMIATLCLTVAAGTAVAALATTRQRTIAVTAGVCALAFADGWIRPMPLGVPPRPFGTPLAAGAHVLELPVDDALVNVSAMYRATQHGRPVVNGYAGYVPPQMELVEWALNRRDPSILTELRRGHPLYVAVANEAPAASWTSFMDAQNDARMVGVSGAGRIYVMPAAPFQPQVTLGAPLRGVHGREQDGWLTYDLGGTHVVRAVEVVTRGHYTLLHATVHVQTSADGATWTTAAEEPSAGLAFTGAMRDPLAVPVLVLLSDPSARFLRVNAPAFGPASVTIYGP